MIIFKRADQLSEYIRRQKDEGRKIGFVPTMGALHQGHLSLIASAFESNDLVICSIFINPTQFNNAEDFKHYPVTVEKDIEQLVMARCSAVFIPSVNEIYPSGYQKKHYDLGPIEHILEGKYRPGHFQGVCQVVDRLLEIVNPHRLYLGQKDLQQCMVIQKLISLTGREQQTQLIIVPTARETDGLAMSSRNLRLDAQQRQQAPSLFRELTRIKDNLNRQNLPELQETAKQSLEQKGFAVDYIEIVNAGDLSPANGSSGHLVALVAAATGNVRLIDNLPLN